MKESGHHSIYYLPDLKGDLNGLIGSELSLRGYYVLGRELRNRPGGPGSFFCNLTFDRQVDSICRDLKNYSWSEHSFVLAHAFGAYLFLHAVLRLGKIPSNCLLISPTLSNATLNKVHPTLPNEERLSSAIGEQSFHSIRLDIVTSQDNSKASIETYENLIKSTNGTISLLENKGLSLTPSFVKKALDFWLPEVRKLA